MWLPVGDGSYRHTHFKKEFNFIKDATDVLKSQSISDGNI